jgi:SAM-dependent methyltransferase
MPVADWNEVLPLVRDDYRDAAARASGAPVLVDFDRSVIAPLPAAGSVVASDVDRQSYDGPSRLLKRLVSPVKDDTLRNVRTFVQHLKAARENPVVLVVGGGSIGQGMKELYSDADLRIVAFDIYHSPHTHFVADAHDIPLRDECCDGVVIQAVLEHVLEPERVVAEIWRVLRPGGRVYAETPFMQQVHEGAYDFTRFTESGHRYLFRQFDRVDSGASGGPGTAFIWSVDYLIRSLFRSRTAGKIAKLCVFWARYLDRLVPEAYAIDSASGVYFLGTKSTCSIAPKEAVAHYLGAQTLAAEQSCNGNTEQTFGDRMPAQLSFFEERETTNEIRRS